MKGRRHFILVSLISIALLVLLVPGRIPSLLAESRPGALDQSQIIATWQGPPVPPSIGAYYSGHYRNLLEEWSDATGQSIDIQGKLNATWHHYFESDDYDNERLYYPVSGTDMGYILTVDSNDIRSEGMSYGMMIAVQLDKKEEFDRLWNFAKTKMQHKQEIEGKANPRKGYFAWLIRSTEDCVNDPDFNMEDRGYIENCVKDQNPASDGEEWLAMALLFAGARWGNTGEINYQAEAQAILDTMLHKEDDPLYGDMTNMFNKTEKQVVFVPYNTSNPDNRAPASFTDPSYHLPAFYELWARWADKDRNFWAEAAATSRQFFKDTAAHSTKGLTPDYAEFNGTPTDPWNEGHDDFRFDAWRVAMNVAVDYAWFAKDKWQWEQNDRLLSFFHREGIGEYGNQYTLSGTRISTDHSTGLVAMNAVAGLASTNPNTWDFVEELWNINVEEKSDLSGEYRYYNGMLYMLALLHLSGNFQIYDPTNKVDVYLLVDLTSSFEDDLPIFKTQAPQIISALKASNPNTQFGLGKFEDYPVDPFGSEADGDKAYERLVDLTLDTDLLLTTISGLSVGNGNDWPESQLPALFQAATGAGQDLSGAGFPAASIPPGQQASFRDGATKLFLLWTDAPFHRPGDLGDTPYPGPSLNETVDAILALDPPQVIGISSGADGIADLEEIAAATHALAPTNGVDCNEDGIIDIASGQPLVCGISTSGEGIGEAIVALVEAATEPTSSVYLPLILKNFDGSSLPPLTNNPPNVPSNPIPGDGATGRSINTDLSWTGGDPDPGDTVTYDVYFEANNSSPDVLICNDVTSTACDPGTLSYETHYYWQVIARDAHGATQAGPVWDFTTGSAPNNPPNTPSNPSPPNGSTNQDINVDLSWTGVDPDPDDAVTYFIYFEASDSTPDILICNDVASAACDPGTLEYDAHYYWQVVARDSYGATRTGPVWDFTTETSLPPVQTLHFKVSFQARDNADNRPQNVPIAIQIKNLDGQIVFETNWLEVTPAGSSSNWGTVSVDVSSAALTSSQSYQIFVTGAMHLAKRVVIALSDGFTVDYTDPALNPDGVLWTCDINQDNQISEIDVNIVGSHNDEPAPTNPDPSSELYRSDQNGDAVINLTDLVICAQNVGKVGD